MRKLVYIIFGVVLVGLLTQVYKMGSERWVLSKEMKEVNKELALVEDDNADLKEKIGYYSNPRNLEKELRARFNYRLPNEKLIIVVPKKESSTNGE
ncbi:MAG: hypothetical protein WD889_01170 [Candidatus Colwellbacteria bacterium]